MQIKKLTPKFLAIFTLLCLLLSAGSAQTTAVDIDLTPCKDGVFIGQTTLWEVDISGKTVDELLQLGVSYCYIEAVGSASEAASVVFSAIVAQEGALKDSETNNLLGPDHLEGVVQLYFDARIDVSLVEARVIKGVRPFAVQGVVFNDLNSSFQIDHGEPVIDIGSVCALVERSTGPDQGQVDEYCSETDENGHYSIAGFSWVNKKLGYSLVIRPEIETDLRYINYPDGSTVYITGPCAGYFTHPRIFGLIPG